jgi:hypothetical protein
MKIKQQVVAQNPKTGKNFVLTSVTVKTPHGSKLAIWIFFKLVAFGAWIINNRHSRYKMRIGEGKWRKIRGPQLSVEIKVA